MGIEPGYMVTSDDDPTKQVFVPSRAGRDPERILAPGVGHGETADAERERGRAILCAERGHGAAGALTAPAPFVGCRVVRPVLSQQVRELVPEVSEIAEVRMMDVDSGRGFPQAGARPVAAGVLNGVGREPLDLGVSAPIAHVLSQTSPRTLVDGRHRIRRRPRLRP